MIDNIVEFIRTDAIKLQCELFLRLIIAVLCGAFIGHERKNQGKGAGTRTHSIVAVASCLMMIISQYGFNDFFTNFNVVGVEQRIDPSRVAAQIVSGIGFLGAGMIFIQKNVVTGLTTAAGIWATAGIGMAIGGGMYVLGIATTAIIVILQMLLHKNSKLIPAINDSEISFVVYDDIKNIDVLIDLMEKYEITIDDISYSKYDNHFVKIVAKIQYPANIDKVALIEQIYDTNVVKSVKL